MNTDIQQRIVPICEGLLKRSLTEMTHDEDLLLNSMALLELFVAIEKEFGIDIDEDEMDQPEQFKSINSISEFVSKQLDQ